MKKIEHYKEQLNNITPMDMETISVDLSYEEIGRLALQAHERDMKLNDYIIELLKRTLGN